MEIQNSIHEFTHCSKNVLPRLPLVGHFLGYFSHPTIPAENIERNPADEFFSYYS